MAENIYSNRITISQPIIQEDREITKHSGRILSVLSGDISASQHFINNSQYQKELPVKVFDL
jgi:hypothetical protein